MDKCTPISSSSHDPAFKRFMMNIRNALDFFLIHLPEELKQNCDFSTLQLQNSAFIDKKLRARMSDILYLVKTKEDNHSIYLLVEHQSKPDKKIAWRMINYAFCIMNQHLQQGHKSLPLVIPILFYHGQKTPYPFDINWTQCLPLPALAQKIYANAFPLIDITIVDDALLLTHKKIAVMEIAMKYANCHDDIDKVAILISQAINQNNCKEEDTLTIVQYLFSVMSTTYFDLFIEKLTEQLDNHREIIMNIAWQLENRGLQKGIEIGGKLARKQLQQEIVQKLLNEDIDVVFIERLLGISLEEIESLT